MYQNWQYTPSRALNLTIHGNSFEKYYWLAQIKEYYYYAGCKVLIIQKKSMVWLDSQTEYTLWILMAKQSRVCSVLNIESEQVISDVLFRQHSMSEYDKIKSSIFNTENGFGYRMSNL